MRAAGCNMWWAIDGQQRGSGPMAEVQSAVHNAHEQQRDSVPMARTTARCCGRNHHRSVLQHRGVPELSTMRQAAYQRAVVVVLVQKRTPQIHGGAHSRIVFPRVTFPAAITHS